MCSATGAFILRLTYGYAAKAEDDPLVRVVEDAMAGFAAASEPGAFWVDQCASRGPLIPYAHCAP
jgi:hypothetical protein